MGKRLLCCLDNYLYKRLKKHVNAMPKRFTKAIAYYYTDSRIRKLYWERLGVIMGEGSYANLGMMVTFKEGVSVEIGNNVSIAPYVTFVADSRANNGSVINDSYYVKEVLTKSETIVVEDEVWIGANVTVLPGVRLGRGSIIGAGSVVTKDVDPHCVYVGVPAKKIRDLSERS